MEQYEGIALKPTERFSGRGIVMCAGGARLFTCAWVALSVLRRTLGCRLPIELWYLGPDELTSVEVALLTELEVTAVDALEIRRRHPARLLGGWELKSFALAHCRFREVLLIDADNVPLRDPAFLFDAARYREAGAAFWPDVHRLAADSPVWDLLGIEYRADPAWESGQIVLDKARHWHPLSVVRAMNDYSEIFYRYSYGDKDTFHLAWRMLDAAFAMPTARVRPAGWGLLQHDFDGEPLFQHRNEAKWSMTGDNPTGAGFAHGEACQAALAALHERWSGRIEPLPARDAIDLARESELASLRLFRLAGARADAGSRSGSTGTVLELLPGNRVGEGRSPTWQRWYVGAGVLTLAGVAGITAELTAATVGTGWRGRSRESDAQELVLAPLVSDRGDPLAAVLAAVLAGVDRGDVSPGAAIQTIETLAAVGEISDALSAERSRRLDGTPAVEVLEQVRWRLGRAGRGMRALEGRDAWRYEFR